MDAKGDGNSLHVIQVRHIPIFKLYNLTVMFTYYRSFFKLKKLYFDELLIRSLKKLFKYDATLIVTFLYLRYFVKLFSLVNQIK